MLTGADLSFANGILDWSQAGSQEHGLHFAYLRVCYGSNPAFDDGAIFTHNHDNAKRANVPLGSYFFWTAWDDPVAQVNHYISAANGRYGDFSPMVDVEEESFIDGGNDGVNGNILKLSVVLQALEKDCGKQPIIYTNSDTWSTYFGNTSGFSGHRLWIASYSDPAGHPTMITGFSKWVIHQYTDHLIVPGAARGVDGDVLNGTDLSILA